MPSSWTAFMLLLTASLTGLAAPPSSQVKTESGVVQGSARDSIQIFLGIPYAAPPVGDLRWKPPAPAARWTGVRKAVEFGPRCMQAPIYPDMIFRDSGGSEDCLSLNVWTPGKTSEAKLPVLFWIHGGGFLAGGSSEPRQDGEMLARRGVVVVSPNYRLGIFGFFVIPELATESEKHAAGNYGLLDQVAALQWVHRNIAAFGGDPENVTIVGESAGSFSVSALMASPIAKGLFHRAIGESGGAFSSRGLPFKSAATRARSDSQFASSQFGTQTLKNLRAIPAQQLLDDSMKDPGAAQSSFGPDIDGYFLPRSVPAIFAAGQQNDVPLLAGWNHDEGSFEMVSAPAPPSPQSMKALAVKEFGPRAQEFLRLYPADTDALARRSMQDLVGDRFIAWSTWNWLEIQARTGKGSIYRYRFDLAPPPEAKGPPGLGAFHSAEIPYVFGTFDLVTSRPWRPEDRQLSDVMQQYWVNFARNGNPNGAGLPEWPIYRSTDKWPVMHLDAQSKAQKDDQRMRYLFLKSAWDR